MKNINAMDPLESPQLPFAPLEKIPEINTADVVVQYVVGSIESPMSRWLAYVVYKYIVCVCV